MWRCHGAVPFRAVALSPCSASPADSRSFKGKQGRADVWQSTHGCSDSAHSTALGRLAPSHLGFCNWCRAPGLRGSWWLAGSVLPVTVVAHGPPPALGRTLPHPSPWLVRTIFPQQQGWLRTGAGLGQGLRSLRELLPVLLRTFPLTASPQLPFAACQCSPVGCASPRDAQIRNISPSGMSSCLKITLWGRARQFGPQRRRQGWRQPVAAMLLLPPDAQHPRALSPLG